MYTTFPAPEQPMTEETQESSEEPPSSPLPHNHSEHVISDRSRRFLHTYFPQTTEAQWNDWRWQIRNRFRKKADIERVLNLTDSGARALEHGK